VSPSRISALRRRLGENTSTFGARFARSGRTVEDWEGGRRRPDKLVRQLMKTLDAQPTSQGRSRRRTVRGQFHQPEAQVGTRRIR